VNRAVKILNEKLNEGKKVCTLGPIIHNPQVIEDLEQRGAKIISAPSEAPEGYEVVIRAHGVTKEVVAELESRGYLPVEYQGAAPVVACGVVGVVKAVAGEGEGTAFGGLLLAVGRRDGNE
jgi:4-hydroxy-3-methylbut-2-enyl diphosphate reductase